MGIRRVIGGAILLVVAIWAFLTLPDPTAKYAGGAILGILGVVLFLTGIKEKIIKQ